MSEAHLSAEALKKYHEGLSDEERAELEEKGAKIIKQASEDKKFVKWFEDIYFQQTIAFTDTGYPIFIDPNMLMCFITAHQSWIGCKASFGAELAELHDTVVTLTNELKELVGGKDATVDTDRED